MAKIYFWYSYSFKCDVAAEDVVSVVEFGLQVGCERGYCMLFTIPSNSVGLIDEFSASKSKGKSELRRPRSGQFETIKSQDIPCVEMN